ncbi:ABC transporter ATP-binding protein [Actinoalloteichus spitiensis]|uniref:ABC transporter ATP-binding protein n=1 Tax=Actinoalloteichus spitiensis TaxID=252394 RepID=UPI0003617D8A|nr:ABC transporter ATP-binding protein [Actinoalloteichus spitiensis]
MTALVEVTDAVRSYPPGVGVRGVSLTVEEGEVHALVGLNGAGKTTLMRLILGMARLRSGKIRIAGTPVTRMTGSGWRWVGHMLDRPFAYPELTALRNMLVAARLRGLSASSAAEAARNALDDAGLGDYATVRAGRLSQGNRQRLGLAVAMLDAPRFLVLDEPTNALAPAGVIDLRERLRRRAAGGAGVLVSSHHLDEVARIAHRITVMNRGEIAGTLDPSGTDLERALFDLVLSDDERRNREQV